MTGCGSGTQSGIKTFASRTSMIGAAALFLFSAGCQEKPASNASFSMNMNGEPYAPKFNPPLGYLQELEAGFSTAHRVRIHFPIIAPGAGANPGLEIEFDPAVIPIGEEVEIVYGEADGGIGVTYFPLFGHRHNEGILLLFTPDDDCPLNIRFDELEPRLGGHVSGSLIFTRLYGHYENMDGEWIDTEERKILEVRNFPFDVQLTGSAY